MATIDRLIIDGFEFFIACDSEGSMDGIVIGADAELSDAYIAALKQAQKTYPVFTALSSLGDYYYYAPMSPQYGYESAEEVLETCEFLLKQTVYRLDADDLALINWVKSFALHPSYPETKPAKKPRRKAPGFVYLIQSPSGTYKIGRSKDPDNRRRTFAVKLPFEVEYIALIQTEDMQVLEEQLHVRFADKRVNGEWFNLTAEDVRYIQSLVGGVE